MPFVELAAGSTFGGRYRVVRRLASGGMGAVYEVVHLETDRRRALKVMLPDLLGSGALRDRFRHEARVTANVQSEFLVDVFDAGVDTDTGMPFLVMELLIGEELGRRVERTGPLPVEEVVGYLEQVATALESTHARSIVHRDLKPANLFLAPREDGSARVKILDFGISKIVSEATSDGITNRSLGTPAYMAPEQLLGEPVSPATDIHALGLIAYTLLVGRSYWQEDVESVDNVFAFALRAQRGPKESPVARAARQGRRLPSAFDGWFERATHRDPSARFPSASLAASALAEALGSYGVIASVPASGQGDAASSFSTPLVSERAAPRFRSSGWLGVGLLAVALLVGGVVLLGRAQSASLEAAQPVSAGSTRSHDRRTDPMAPASAIGRMPAMLVASTNAAASAKAPSGETRLTKQAARPGTTKTPSSAKPAEASRTGSPSAGAPAAVEKPRRHTRD